MVGDENIRIGDSEREAAVAELQNHLAAGRLSPAEFNERMDKAFAARTASELRALFFDLPSTGTSSPYGDPLTQPYADPYAGIDQGYGAQPPVVSQWSATPAESDQTPSFSKPWYAQWWMLLAAIMLSGIFDGRLWFLVPAMAIWIWVIYPGISKSSRRRPEVAAAPPRPMTYAERDEVMLALHNGGEVAAIGRYRQLTGADLYTATMTVRALHRELGS